MVLTVGELNAEKSLGKRRHQNPQLSHKETCLKKTFLKTIYYMSHLYETHKNGPSTRLKGDEHLPGFEARNLSGSRWAQGPYEVMGMY